MELPLLLLEAATFFSSARNSSEIALASTPLALALDPVVDDRRRALLHFGLQRLVRLTILTPAPERVEAFLVGGVPELPQVRAVLVAELLDAPGPASAACSTCPSFMKKPNAELYMPGRCVACSSTVSSLNETIDSSGKNTPSATPDFSQLVGLGRGLDEGGGADAFATCSATPPPVRIFRPLMSLMLATGFLVNIWPGPWVNTPISLTPLYSPTL